MNQMPFTLRDVLSICQVPLDVHSKNTSCPFCGGKHAMNYDFTKSVFHCFKCDTKGGAIDFYKAYMQISDSKVAYHDIMAALFGGFCDDNFRQQQIEQRKAEIETMQVKESSIRSVQDRNETYSQLISMTSLAPDHFKNLRMRGLSETAIIKNGYRTIPSEHLTDICRLLMHSGVHLDGVPGFYQYNGAWSLRAAKRGIMIPIRNHENLIQGFQIRKDKTDADGAAKYFWLSSKGYTSGTGAPSDVHYACTFRDGNPIIEDDKIYLTEGALKGDIAHHLSSKPFLCVAGVCCLKRLKPELEWLKECGVNIVNICYDMDYKTNPSVQKALNETCEMIGAIGLQPQRVEWDAQYKGIDDYLLARRNLFKSSHNLLDAS